MVDQIVHFEIPGDITTKGREFWGSLFGWTFDAYPGPSEYHMTRTGDQTGAITNLEPGKREIRVYFAVNDINSAATRVKELGGEACDPLPVPSMAWFSICLDTQGNEFGHWQNDPSAKMPTS